MEDISNNAQCGKLNLNTEIMPELDVDTQMDDHDVRASPRRLKE